MAVAFQNKCKNTLLFRIDFKPKHRFCTNVFYMFRYNISDTIGCHAYISNLNRTKKSVPKIAITACLLICL